jgi:aminocarboxymuconate-semialdehyde decarboxylase
VRIDIHAHCFPADYLDALEAAGRRDLASVHALGAGDSADDLDRRRAAMDEAGVELEVLSPSSLVPAFDDPATAVAAAELLNDRLAAVAAADPDRFAVLAGVPLPHVEEAARLLPDAIARPGAVGIAVATSIAGVSIADPRFEPFFAELDRLGALLFIHPAGEAADLPLVDALGLGWPLGAPLEDIVSVTALIARGIPSRFPRIRIVNAHLGAGIATLLARLDAQFPRVVPDAPELPSVAARRMWFDTVSHGSVIALRAAVDSFGADRLVLGTDVPYVRGAGHKKAIDHIALSGLRPEDADAILERNAAALVLGGGS